MVVLRDQRQDKEFGRQGSKDGVTNDAYTLDEVDEKTNNFRASAKYDVQDDASAVDDQTTDDLYESVKEESPLMMMKKMMLLIDYNEEEF
ncbi:hypothetical protein Dimus_033624, partial [Dionaea muscipula]